MDIWNHIMSKIFKCVPDGERYEAMNKYDYECIKYLENVLVMFTEWSNDSKITKSLIN